MTMTSHDGTSIAFNYNKYIEFPEKSSIQRTCKCEKVNDKDPCSFCETRTELKHLQKDCSLVDFVFFNVSDSVYTKTKLRRLLLNQLGCKGFLVRDQIKEVVDSYQKTLPKTKQKESYFYYSPMHYIFLCKCGWMLFNPTTLPCGHTICKHCADTHMFCSYCGHTLESPSSPNLFLVEIIESWFPNEYIGTRHKRDANELYKSKDYELALNEIRLALDLLKDDYFAFNIRAKVYIEMKEYKLALKDANRSCKIHQECGDTQFIRGTCFSHLGNLNGAIDAFQLCLELEPEDLALSNAVLNKLDEILSLSDTSDKISVSEFSDADSDSSSDEAGKSETKDKTKLQSASIDTNENSSENQVIPNQNALNVKKNPQIDENITKNDNVHQEGNESENENDKPCSSKTTNEKSPLHPYRDIQSTNTEKPKPIEKIHGVPKHLVKEDDFECKLCYELLYKPITTSCGHVFCKKCLLRTLDHNPTCPVCRMSLTNFLENPLKPVTYIIEEVVELFFIAEFNKRKERYQERMERLSR